jgi:hypothetical protein
MRHLAVLSLALALSSPAAAADRTHPVVVELFQSQGCSSCPPANATLNAIAGRPDILALSFAVTYWDRLGWKDSFASPAYTARQWDYARAGGRGEVATPQMIVDGETVLNGGNQREVEAVIARSGRGSSGPTIASAAGKVAIGPGTTDRAATVWLVRYDPRVQNVAIRAGENGGRTLPHRNIVRSIEALGQWRGTALALPLPAASNAAYRSAILIQSGKGGPVLAAAKL